MYKEKITFFKLHEIKDLLWRGNNFFSQTSNIYSPLQIWGKQSNSHRKLARYYNIITVNSTVPQDFHESAVSGAQEPINHLFPHYISPYRTFAKETLDPHPNVQEWIITFTYSHIPKKQKTKKTVTKVNAVKELKKIINANW